MSDLATRTREIIADQLAEYDETFDRSRVIDTANLVEDLGADSLDVVDLKLRFETEFGLDLNDLDGRVTVGDLISYLENEHGRRSNI